MDLPTAVENSYQDLYGFASVQNIVDPIQFPYTIPHSNPHAAVLPSCHSVPMVHHISSQVSCSTHFDANTQGFTSRTRRVSELDVCGHKVGKCGEEAELRQGYQEIENNLQSLRRTHQFLIESASEEDFRDAKVLETKILASEAMLKEFHLRPRRPPRKAKESPALQRTLLGARLLSDALVCPGKFGSGVWIRRTNLTPPATPAPVAEQSTYDAAVIKDSITWGDDLLTIRDRPSTPPLQTCSVAKNINSIVEYAEKYQLKSESHQLHSVCQETRRAGKPQTPTPSGPQTPGRSYGGTEGESMGKTVEGSGETNLPGPQTPDRQMMGTENAEEFSTWNGRNSDSNHSYNYTRGGATSHYHPVLGVKMKVERFKCMDAVINKITSRATLRVGMILWRQATNSGTRLLGVVRLGAFRSRLHALQLALSKMKLHADTSRANNAVEARARGRVRYRMLRLSFSIIRDTAFGDAQGSTQVCTDKSSGRHKTSYEHTADHESSSPSICSPSAFPRKGDESILHTSVAALQEMVQLQSKNKELQALVIRHIVLANSQEALISRLEHRLKLLSDAQKDEIQRREREAISLSVQVAHLKDEASSFMRYQCTGTDVATAEIYGSSPDNCTVVLAGNHISPTHKFPEGAARRGLVGGVSRSGGGGGAGEISRTLVEKHKNTSTSSRDRKELQMKLRIESKELKEQQIRAEMAQHVAKQLARRDRTHLNTCVDTADTCAHTSCTTAAIIPRSW